MISLIVIIIALTLAGYSSVGMTNDTKIIIMVICILSDLNLLTNGIGKGR